MKSTASFYEPLREYIGAVPLIDCHDHSDRCGPKPADPVDAVFDWYMRSDMHSALGDQIAQAWDVKRPLEERWPLIERAWQRTRHTGYAQVVKRAVREFYGEDDLTLDALRRIGDKMIDFSDEQVYTAVLDKAGIVVRLEDTWPPQKEAIAGTLRLPPRSKLVISLPGLHRITRAEDVYAAAGVVDQYVTTLDDYLAACWAIFEGMKAAGAAAFKDQSAYERSLEYGNPTRAEAEAAFNWIMEDPRRSLSYPDGARPLSDYLFHHFMRMARDLDLPVQLHTGHMAGIRNEITKTNAVGLTRLLELHRETRFDLFHANWPYSGEILFLVKNYPNVALDFCWAHMVDPLYSQALLKQAVSSVPHGKIHGYGSDLNGSTVTSAWAHAELARDNIAAALADLVEIDYLRPDEAQHIARAWLFDNPNEFFRLGC